MNKLLKVLPLSLSILASVSVHAANSEYTNKINTVKSIEKNLMQCIPDVEQSYLCYSKAGKDYTKLITDIRNKHSDKVDSKLWNYLNVKFNERSKNCRNSDFDGGTQKAFYPNLDCLNSILHQQAITTIELHLK
ncbi:TPA: hypothetical protein ACJEU7_001857 [Acinetobacter baumannii]